MKDFGAIGAAAARRAAVAKMGFGQTGVSQEIIKYTHSPANCLPGESSGSTKTPVAPSWVPNWVEPPIVSSKG